MSKGEPFAPHPAPLSWGGRVVMIASGTELHLDELAQRFFQVLIHLDLELPRSRRRGDLKEMEFHTLALLQQHHTLIVGDLQRYLSVLPAQMSRIIRSLESREEALIACCINPQDKRKINVKLTPAG